MALVYSQTKGSHTENGSGGVLIASISTVVLLMNPLIIKYRASKQREIDVWCFWNHILLIMRSLFPLIT